MKSSFDFFINQTEATTGSTHPVCANGYSAESLSFSVESDGAFLLEIYTRINPKFDYHPIDIITDQFDVISNVTKNGNYTVSIGGRSSIQMRLISLEDGTKLNCHANLY